VTGYVKKTAYHMCGYGENDIGPFTLDGTMTVRNSDKIQEKDGVPGYKKIRVADFSIKKTYQKVIIEELVDEVINRREEAREFENAQAEARERKPPMERNTVYH
jgi:hypothetical protein